MRGRVFLIVMLTATAVRAQVAPPASGGFAPWQAQMMAPPPVNGMGYQTELGSEVRSNYLRAGLAFTTAYINNLYAGGSSTSIAETTFSVLPSIEYDATSAGRHTLVTYNPGFTFYQPSSELNEVDNTATLGYEMRLAEHAMLTAADSFQDSSSPFSPGIDNTVSGLPVSSTPGVTPPFAKRLTNYANVELTAQPGLNLMVGALGQASLLDYPNPAQTTGLYDFYSSGGTVFCDWQLPPTQIFGISYQYLDMVSSPTGLTSTTEAETISGNYTFRFNQKLSMSVSGGPQYYKTVERPLPTTSAWGTSWSTSMGWQGTRTSFAASYAQGVTGGGGLLGAYHSRAANATARWQMARAWTASAYGAYSINKSVSPLLITSVTSGHSVSGGATLDRTFGEQFSVDFHYDHVHQSYSNIIAIATNPDSDRETISVTWHFQRPMGR
jgi:hypothetical protein